jgi:hypothetical protein
MSLRKFTADGMCTRITNKFGSNKQVWARNRRDLFSTVKSPSKQAVGKYRLVYLHVTGAIKREHIDTLTRVWQKCQRDYFMRSRHPPSAFCINPLKAGGALAIAVHAKIIQKTLKNNSA